VRNLRNRGDWWGVSARIARTRAREAKTNTLKRVLIGTSATVATSVELSNRIARVRTREAKTNNAKIPEYLFLSEL
jgi:hypothetical protein